VARAAAGRICSCTKNDRLQIGSTNPRRLGGSIIGRDSPINDNHNINVAPAGINKPKTLTMIVRVKKTKAKKQRERGEDGGSIHGPPCSED